MEGPCLGPLFGGEGTGDDILILKPSIMGEKSLTNTLSMAPGVEVDIMYF